MAEHIALNDLVTSTLSLSELAKSIVAKVHKYTFRSIDVPELFYSLPDTLSSLISWTQQTTSQARTSPINEDIIHPLQPTVSSTVNLLSILHSYFLQIDPSADTTNPQKAAEALQRLGQEVEVRQLVEKICVNIDLLTTSHDASTVRNASTTDSVLGTLSQLHSEEQIQANPQHTGHTYSIVNAGDGSALHLGDVVYNVYPAAKLPELRLFGLCIAAAPLIDANYFIGRIVELDQMADVLQPGSLSVEQRRLVLGGMGGFGKTQLAIAYARQYHASYSSTLWLNAKSALTLRESFSSFARQLNHGFQTTDSKDGLSLGVVHDWLSDARNTSWLLIFDNYDEPREFDIREYIPNTAHGSIIITTRLPDLLRGQFTRQIRVSVMSALSESLEILQTRSHRHNLSSDADARRLAIRLGGLPLALATAGAYLRKTTLTFAQYLDAYEKRFNINPRKPTQLPEYDHTLYTTWNLSYNQIETQDPVAAKLLRLLAYFHSEVWYDLLHAGLKETSSQWLQEMAAEQIDFENVISVLVDYCLLEAHTESQSYSMHSCVHDWTLVVLNKEIDPQLYWYAFDCVEASIERNDFRCLDRVRYSRIAQHGTRLASSRFSDLDGCQGGGLSERLDEATWIVQMLTGQTQFSAAERMCLWVLSGYRKALRHTHWKTTNCVLILGRIYHALGRLTEAEQIHMQVLSEVESNHEPNGTWTAVVTNNLGSVLYNQGRLKEAEKMYKRSWAESEQFLGPNHYQTLGSICSLGVVYYDQGKYEEAEHMYRRVLTNPISDDRNRSEAASNLGVLYLDQRKLQQAEQMLQQALTERNQIFGPDQLLTLDTLSNLGNLYYAQNRLDEAEQMFLRALAGYQKALEFDHSSTLTILHNLGLVYRGKGNPVAAVQMFERALAGQEKTFGFTHNGTISTADNLRKMYYAQDETVKAEEIEKRYGFSELDLSENCKPVPG